MERWKESQLNQFSRTTELDTAYRIALGFAKNIGFKFLAFSTTYATGKNQSNTVRWNNYPNEWNTEYEQQNLRTVDPVVAHCNQSMFPILWTEQLYAKLPLLWEALETQGLQHGWSQSVHDPEGGMCSILSLARSHCAISALELYENLGFSIFLGRHLHELVAQSLPKHSMKPAARRLTPREVDVLKLAAAGKTAEASARILNLSPRTIHFHSQSAMEKLGADTKIGAIVAAIGAGYPINSSVHDQ